MLAEPKTIYADGETGQKNVTPNPGQQYDEVPYRSSTLVMPGPKTIYDNYDMGQKFVDPSPGQPSEEVV